MSLNVTHNQLQQAWQQLHQQWQKTIALWSDPVRWQFEREFWQFDVVKAYRAVRHNNRDVEFIEFKESMLDHCSHVLKTMDTDSWSCEDWAEHLIVTFDLAACEVMEDGENGAILLV